METQSNNHFFLPLVLIVAGVVGGYFSYQAGFDSAKSLAESSNVGGVFRTYDDVRVLSGSVTAVNGDRFTFHTEAINPFDKKTITDRTVIITSDTKIEKVVRESGGLPTTQTPTSTGFKKTAVDASSINVGDMVTVTASENVKMLTEFTATSIQLFPRASKPATPTS